jgi:UDP-glucuronate decarboxylase
MKTCLILGGAGFIGSNLCERKLKDGDRVICVDTFYTSKPYNIERFEVNEKFQFTFADVKDVSKLSFPKIDEIYNLACPASPIHYQKDKIFTFMTNILGMKNALDLARKNECKILQASTSEVYGDALVHPQKETYWGNVNPDGIRSCYDEGKRGAETLCFDYNREFGTKIKVVRIFNTYGPGMNPEDGRVVSNFIIQALKGDDITIYGDGSQTRSFQYVDDLINGFLAAMETDDSFVGPVNIGNPGEFTILELAKKVIKLTGSKSKLIFKELPSDDPKQRKPDISLAKEKLNWGPKIDLETGLKKTIEYFKSL